MIVTNSHELREELKDFIEGFAEYGIELDMYINHEGSYTCLTNAIDPNTYKKVEIKHGYPVGEFKMRISRVLCGKTWLIDKEPVVVGTRPEFLRRKDSALFMSKTVGDLMFAYSMIDKLVVAQDSYRDNSLQIFRVSVNEYTGDMVMRSTDSYLSKVHFVNSEKLFNSKYFLLEGLELTVRESLVHKQFKGNVVVPAGAKIKVLSVSETGNVTPLEKGLNSNGLSKDNFELDPRIVISYDGTEFNLTLRALKEKTLLITTPTLC